MEERQYCKGIQAAARGFQRHVEIGQHQAESGGLAVDSREKQVVRLKHRLQRPAKVVQLLLRHRHKAPVLFPGGVINVLKVRDGGVQLLYVHQIDGYVPAAAYARDYFFKALGKARRHFHPEGQQVLCLGEAGGLYQPGVIGRIVRHHYHGRGIEAFQQQPAGFVGGGVHRAADLVHALRAQVFFRRREEPGRGFFIFLAVEKAEKAAVLSVKGVVRAVHYRREAAGGPAGAVSHEKLPLSVAPERVAEPQQVQGVFFKLSHPIGVVPEKGKRIVYEGAEFSFGKFFYFNGHKIAASDRDQTLTA